MEEILVTYNKHWRKEKYSGIFNREVLNSILNKLKLKEIQILIGIKYIINFPTKNHWKERSRLEYIINGLDDLVEVIKKYNIKSIAIPPLGCGNGGLNWNDVKPLITRKLGHLSDVRIVIFEPSLSIWF